MFSNLVTYHLHNQISLPPINALGYQYILAANGVFVRAETNYFKSVLPISPCTVRGLKPLKPMFQLSMNKLPGRLLDKILFDARSTPRTENKLNESLYQFHLNDCNVQVKRPFQQATTSSVVSLERDSPTIFCDLHSHGDLPAFWSATDNGDEQGARLYAVIGNIIQLPEIRLRVGIYGYWMALPVTAVFTHAGSFKDLYEEDKH